MKRNPTLPPNFMLGYAIAAPNLQNYYSHSYKFPHPSTYMQL
ncbi:MAG: hypothetical protein RM368_13875 [Nostoc sp. DedSLP03]|nr:hypothetical protein [Nostoc sp. DedSLP03]